MAFRVVILDADITVGTSIGTASEKLRSIDPSVKLIISSGYIPGPELIDPKHTVSMLRYRNQELRRAPLRTISSLMS